MEDTSIAQQDDPNDLLCVWCWVQPWHPWVWPSLVYHQRVGWSILFTFASCSVFISIWPSFLGITLPSQKLTGKLNVYIMEMDTTYLIFTFLVLQLYICPYAFVTTRRHQNAKIDVFQTSVSSEAWFRIHQCPSM
jgi:hypothetical protein